MISPVAVIAPFIVSPANVGLLPVVNPEMSACANETAPVLLATEVTLASVYVVLMLVAFQVPTVSVPTPVMPV